MSNYIVKKGDNLTKIAKNNGMTLEQLMKLNNISADKANYIQIGQTLKVQDTNSDNPQITIDPHYQVPRLVFDPGQDGTSLKQRPKPLSQPTTQTLQPKPVDQATYLKNNAKSVQQQLLSLGYNLGKYGADGNWGNASQTAFDQAVKDGYMFNDGKFISIKPKLKSKTPPKTFDEAMQQTSAYQRRQMIEQFSKQAKQITQTPVTQTPTSTNLTTGSAFYISYPEHKISTSGTGLDHIFTKGYFPIIQGHAASIILDENGNATYHTYGRYNSKGSYITKSLPARKQNESENDYLIRIRPHLEYADAKEPVKATYIPNVNAQQARKYYKSEPEKDNYGFITGSTCVGEACAGINAGRSKDFNDFLQTIVPNTPNSPHDVNFKNYKTYEF